MIHAHINLLKPEQRVRERTVNDKEYPLIPITVSGIFYLPATLHEVITMKFDNTDDHRLELVG